MTRRVAQRPKLSIRAAPQSASTMSMDVPDADAKISKISGRRPSIDPSSSPNDTLISSSPEGLVKGKKQKSSDWECIEPPHIHASKPPTVPPASDFDLLLQLDNWSRPGLSVAAFKKLFASCICGLVMTRRAFKIWSRKPSPNLDKF
ncbi:hypothetical protein SERLA73DRAFT_152873 [Serpula lacrymans var. lacrymans S7.3]|uniref:Uncharacterized protein n=2 Tax=Serpula lacrymans var. lacrymans TaxID=341189 RepID=F8PZ92_SERL3|nr:uncharacterized protein SERLADRAFT_408620 [Serpula lacrymans var. lacrymans S7.9]EGN99205.1 hypothetical protein SERLA73DRAFT_152873 [Serpula lacrymans var. lacrymans S7.3]EGO24771.1 hypothetical protein SERLADRAFT_408620 [Serpula lacrymans var. lacrymans S7.9]